VPFGARPGSQDRSGSRSLREPERSAVSKSAQDVGWPKPAH